MQHCSYLSELFNHMPQSEGLGITSQSAYIFPNNVVLKALRLVNQGFCKPPALAVGLLTDSFISETPYIFEKVCATIFLIKFYQNINLL